MGFMIVKESGPPNQIPNVCRNECSTKSGRSLEKLADSCVLLIEVDWLWGAIGSGEDQSVFLWSPVLQDGDRAFAGGPVRDLWFFALPEKTVSDETASCAGFNRTCGRYSRCRRTSGQERKTATSALHMPHFFRRTLNAAQSPPRSITHRWTCA